MKRISKILLPLSAVAATATAVTPLVACGNEWSKGIDLLRYKPSASKICTKESLTEQQATDELFNNKNAVDLIKQDILTYLAWESINELPIVLAYLGFYWVGNVVSEKCLLSGLSMNYDQTKHIAYLSGTIRLRAETHMVDAYGSVIGKYTLETKHEINKMPYHMVFTRIDLEYTYWDYWTSYSNVEELKADTNWTVNRSYSGVAVYDDKSKDDEKKDDTFLYKHDTLTTENWKELSMICWWSYYLKNVKKAS